MNKVMLTLVSASFFLNMPCFANEGKQIYGSMKTLEGEWVLSSADKQEGKATKHKLVVIKTIYSTIKLSKCSARNGIYVPL